MTSNRIDDKMGLNELKLLSKRISEFDNDKLNIETVKFCGTTGEPLVNPNTVYGIKLFKDKNKKVVLYTNGLWLNEKTKEGKAYYEYILDADKVNISLDAGTKETFFALKGVDGFDRIISSIKKMFELKREKNSQLRIDISFVVGSDNYKEIYTAAKIAKESGANNIVFRFDFLKPDTIRELIKEIELQKTQALSIQTPGFRVFFANSEEDLKANENKELNAFSSRGKKCFNHHFWGCIGSNCELYACGHRTYKEVKSFGSLIDNSLKKLWTSEKRLDKVDDLPDNKCQFCSPSCHRRDCMMGFLSDLGHGRAKYLHTKYIERRLPQKLAVIPIK